MSQNRKFIASFRTCRLQAHCCQWKHEDSLLESNQTLCQLTCMLHLHRRAAPTAIVELSSTPHQQLARSPAARVADDLVATPPRSQEAELARPSPGYAALAMERSHRPRHHCWYCCHVGVNEDEAPCSHTSVISSSPPQPVRLSSPVHHKPGPAGAAQYHIWPEEIVDELWIRTALVYPVPHLLLFTSLHTLPKQEEEIFYCCLYVYSNPQARHKDYVI